MHVVFFIHVQRGENNKINETLFDVANTNDCAVAIIDNEGKTTASSIVKRKILIINQGV